MNSKSNQIADLKLSFRIAENVARKRSSKAWLMANLLIPKPGRNYLFLCYAYLRWVDNFIDDKNKTFDEKKNFIEKQKQLFLSLLNRKEININSNEEAFLKYYISFSLDHKEEALAVELQKMIEAMSMDVYRLERNGIFSEQELSCYISLLNKSMFGLVHSFMFPGDDYDYKNLGELLWYAGTLRDFFKDVDDGYLNISMEKIEEYKLNIKNLKDDVNLSKWIEEKINYSLNLLEGEILILKGMSFKVRAFWVFAYPFYLHKILRIKMYNYSFNYQLHLNLIKELKALVASIISGLKAVSRILFQGIV